ncbi:MAG: DUF4097 family beta strand repeat protein [Candidatus Didemnitutus sp.]|nr:DUF4097 family beta strand repeat protein [Candidatus Didemnitutus sp.]
MISSALRLPAFLAAATLLVTSASAKVTEKFSQTHPLGATGTVALTNMNGDVEIVGWDKAEVSIEAEKSARTDEELKRIEIVVEATADHVSIKTKHQRTEGGSWWHRNDNVSGAVHYVVHVPAKLLRVKIDAMNSNISTDKVSAAMKLETMNGRIRANGLTGDAEFDTMNGRISASFDRLGAGQKVNVDTMNGQCEIFVPADASARVNASSMNGHVSSELPITVEKSSRRSLHGALGKGEASLSMDSMNGSLSIRART